MSGSSGTIPVAIVGAGGFTGCELAWILAGHPVFETVALFGSGGGDGVRAIADVEPRLRGVVDLNIEAASVGEILASGARVVFLATPHGVSAELAGPLVNAGVTVVDLSGAFRLRDGALHAAHYGFARDAALVDEAVYGLPERTRGTLAGASLVACAGCYVTAASIPLGVLAEAGAFRAGTRPIVDAVSGVSGAGRGASMNLGAVSARPYGVGSHRHAPEIEMNVGPVVFQPQLGAYDRGILGTMHVELSPEWEGADVGAAFGRAFAGEPFVRVMPEGVWPSVAGVRGTNFIDVAWHVDEERAHAVVFAAIDNLVKGASGQAVQCANIAVGIDETAGLLPGGVRTAAGVGA
ncbi:MAG: N-acetyl-gamma-glutamyl-phosphate reductase [Phycisphaeraceae bacterium]|nr:MAG: N-acetyl-gamma-glutamyl-phosphate reductase [Phycisphaeraceae bacterium]